MPARRWLSAAVAVAAALAVAGGAEATTFGDGTLAVSTVSPTAPHAGTPLTIDVTSTTGEPVRVCLVPGFGASHCQNDRHDEESLRRFEFTAPYAGRWTIVADAGTERVTQPLQVLPHGDRLTVLAVGDSLVQSLAHGLAGRLHLRRNAVFKKDVELGRGLSKGDGFNWMTTARDNVDRWHPDVVVVFLGGNEGYALDGYECCTAGWVERFAGLQRQLMQIYSTGGTTRVYWCTLPAPGPDLESRRTVWAAENLALRSAAADDDARVFDTDALLTPGFQWRRGMLWRGRWRVTRQDDEIHLNRLGGRIAAWALLKQLRRDGVDVPLPALRAGVGRNVP